MLPATPATSRLTDSSDSNTDSGGGGGAGHQSGGSHHHHHHSNHHEPFVNSAECTSPHEGRQQISTILPVNIDTLFHTLYARSKFLDDFHASRKIFDIEHTDWRLDEETNKRRRTFKCKMPIKASIGPKFSCITEIQTLRECSRPGSLYAVDITSWNENVPYGDVFTIYVHHCLVRTVDDHTMFSVYLHVKFRKSVFSVIKSLIEKTTYSGVEDFHNDLALQLSRHFCSPPVRHKRHHRNVSRTKIATEPLGESTESVKSTTVSPNKSNADPSSAHANNHPKSHSKVATGIASYSAHELFVQHNLNGGGTAGNSPTCQRDSSLPRNRSAACMLLLAMIAISLLNVGLFVRLNMLSEGGRQQRQQHPDNLLLMSDIRPQDVANLSSDQWIRMFYSYHIQHQNRLAEMRNMLIGSIGSLKQMEANMLAVITAIVPPSPLSMQHGQPDDLGSGPRTVMESTNQENASIDADLIR